MDTQLTHQPDIELILSIQNIISHLLSSSEEEKLKGESMFDAMKEQDPNSLALHLAQLVGTYNCHNIYFREKCAKLLHNLLTDDKGHNWYNNSCVSTQRTLKFIILTRINYEEYSEYIIKMLCFTVSELCNISNNWSDLFYFLHECIASDSNRLKLSFFWIFARLALDRCIMLVPDIMTLHPLFLKTLNDDALNLLTRAVALAATTNFIQCASTLNKLKHVESLYPAMMRTLADALSKVDPDGTVQSVLICYIDLAKNEPRFFRTDIVDAVNTMFEIAEATNLKKRTRHLALEFLLTLVEARVKAPGMMKKIPLFTHNCFGLLLNLLLDVKDEPTWHSAEEYIGWEWGTDSYKYGWQLLKRFSDALGGKTVTPVALEHLDAYLVSGNWENRHAALTAFVSIAQGCAKATAAEALNYYFINSGEAKTLLPYLDAIFNKLLLLLQNGNQMVQEKVLDALGSVAFSSQEYFQKYYDFIMPHLKTILINANGKSNHMLRSTLGCISMVGLAVDKEKFKDDVKQVVEVLVSSQESLAQEFGNIVYVLMVWQKFGYCMRKDFFPYMSAVMPLLVKCAQLQPSNIIDGLNDSIPKVKFGDEMVYVKRFDFLRVKSLACANFGIFAQILEEDFYPLIPQAISILIPLLKLYIHNDVRKEASTALHQILKSLKLAIEKGTAQGENESYFKQLSCDIIRALEDALYTEPEIKVCSFMLLSFRHCVEICGPLLSENLFPRVIDVIKHVITKSSYRRGELTQREKFEDFDAEEAELMREDVEQEENLLINVGYILSRLIETFKGAFLPFLDELSSYLMPTRGKDKTTAESFTGIVIFNELVKQCGEAALKYYKIYFPFLLESSNGENTTNRQNALYGLGLCAEYGITVFKPFVGEVLPRITKVITHLYAREPENELAFDNAISALSKICQFHRESIDSQLIIPAWLDCLPIKGDMNEAKDVHNQLSLMVERLDVELLGPNYEHFPKIMSVFAEVLCAEKDLATEETKKRMINVLSNLRKIIPVATWALAWSLLLPQHKMELECV